MSSNTAVVSVITRTKDRAILLRRAIKSVVSQSHQHWQMIIVNDGGEPEPVDALVAEFKTQSRGRIKVIHNPRSLGMEAASNRGLLEATGEYILIHDDDDSLHSSFMELMIEHIESTGSMGIVCNSIRILESIKNSKVYIYDRELFNPELNGLNLFTMLSGNMFSPISFMYKRKVLSEIGMYDENLPVLGDWDFNIRFMEKYDIDVLALPLAYYHHRLDATGSYGNSVIDGNDKHKKYLNILRSKYLRQDLNNSITGIGELINVAHAIREAR